MFGFGIAIACVGALLLIWWIWSIVYQKMNRTFSKILLAIFAFAAIAGGIIMILVSLQSESFKRWKKDLESEYDGGLERRITVVGQNGEILKEYEGRMDIQSNEGDKIVFVMDGKKYIIYNSSIFNTIFVEELSEKE